MKTRICLCAIVATLLSGTVLSQENESQLNISMINAAFESASTKFTNRDMYMDEERWIGTTIRVEGFFENDLKPVLNTNRPYEEFRGTFYTDLIVFYDPRFVSNPWRHNDTLKSAIADQNTVWAIGTIRKCVEVITQKGVVERLPVMELMLVLRKDDYTNSKPLYVSSAFRY